MLVWLSVWSKVQIVCIWSSSCHCHHKTQSSLSSFKSRWLLPFCHRLTQFILQKRLLYQSVCQKCSIKRDKCLKLVFGKEPIVAYCTLCYNRICISPKTKAHAYVILSVTLDVDNFYAFFPPRYISHWKYCHHSSPKSQVCHTECPPLFTRRNIVCHMVRLRQLRLLNSYNVADTFSEPSSCSS